MADGNPDSDEQTAWKDLSDNPNFNVLLLMLGWAKKKVKPMARAIAQDPAVVNCFKTACMVLGEKNVPLADRGHVQNRRGIVNEWNR